MSENLGNHFQYGLRLFVVVLLLSLPAMVIAEKTVSVASKGKVLAVKLCQACHMFEGGTQAGNVGPPFTAMKARFPDRKKLHDIIYDPQKVNPDTMMPPFGRHGFVNKGDINSIIDFLYTQ